MRAALLDICRFLVAGSGLEAMITALTLSEKGDVLLVTQDTCLYAEMNAAGDYRVPAGGSAHWKALLFPAEVMDKELCHPDRLKQYGERLMQQHGVRLLYACHLIGQKDGCALAAHKSGLYAIRFEKCFDCRPTQPLLQAGYALHTMHQGEHRVLLVPTDDPGTKPLDRFRRYEQALTHLPAGDTLARGGAFATELSGLRMPRGASAPRGFPLLETENCQPQSLNPLYQDHPAADLPAHCMQFESYDVVVAGGGTAGSCAALFCARQGLRTLLIEMNSVLGGTATAGGVSIYWFGLRDGATAQIDQAVDAYYQQYQLPRNRCLWSDNDVFLPDLKAQALLKLCLQAGVEIRFESVACGVERAGTKVLGVYYADQGTLKFARSAMLLDCTGDGDVCMFANAAHHYGSERDGMTYWGSLAQFTAPDHYRNNFSTMVHVGDPLDYTRFILAGRQRGENLYDHGQYVALRESRHIRGMDIIHLEDILLKRPVRKPLYTCFSNYDPKGQLTADCVFFGLLPPNLRVQVPRGAVIPVDADGRMMEGILVGGKAISCCHDAFPGIRMQPDLQRQGLALAALAGCALRQKTDAWQAEGVEACILNLGGDVCETTAVSSPSLAQAVAAIDGTECWEWLESDPGSWMETPAPVTCVMMADAQEALALLKPAYEQAEKKEARLSLARLMLWHGDESGAQNVIAAIQELFAQTEGLPLRKASTLYGQMLPDHGLMPEAVYLLNTLAHTRQTQVLPLFEEMVGRLERFPRDWKDLRCGIYCYCESVAYVASRRRDPQMIPLLHRVLALPELQGEASDQLLQERFGMLKLGLLSALHQLGDANGTNGLQHFLHDLRRPFAQAASMLLNAAE